MKMIIKEHNIDYELRITSHHNKGRNLNIQRWWFVWMI